MTAARFLFACVLLPLCTACSTSSPLIANKTLNISPGLHPTYEVVGAVALAGVAVWYVADPLAPNWGIQSTKLADGRFQIDLKQKRFAIGGDGEANQSFHRTAAMLAQKNGFATYSVLSYTEGIEAGPLLSQRVSRGVVQLEGMVSAQAPVTGGNDGYAAPEPAEAQGPEAGPTPAR